MPLYITAQTTPSETELLCSLERTGNELSLLVYPIALLLRYTTHPLPGSVASALLTNSAYFFGASIPHCFENCKSN